MNNAGQWAAIMAGFDEPDPIPGFALVTTLPDGLNVVTLLQPSAPGAQSGRFGRGIDKSLAAAYAQAARALRGNA
jgi:hypothetical protein